MYKVKLTVMYYAPGTSPHAAPGKVVEKYIQGLSIELAKR